LNQEVPSLFTIRYSLFTTERGVRMQTLWQDLRYGARTLFKNRSFTAVAIIAIALGIGANTAIFSVVNAVLLRPLPYNEPERLVAVWETDTRKADSKGSISYPNFFDWRERNQSLENVAVYHGAGFSMIGEGNPIQLSGQVVSAEIFDLLHIKPHLGRSFRREDEKYQGASSSHAAIISHRLWQRQFGADADIIGRKITLERKPFEIVGVMPAGFQFPIQADPVEIWVTPAVDGQPNMENKAMTERRGFRLLQGLARLKPGVTLEQAQAEMDVIAGALREEYPDNNFAAGIRLKSFHSDLVNEYSTALLFLFGAVGCVLLIACANVANLMLARTTARYKEIAVRAALGAGRLRLVRQLLTESVLLSLVGGLLGLLLAWWGIEILIQLIPEDLPRLSEIQLDRWVLGFTFLLSFITGVLFGVIPAIQGSKTDLNEAMKEGARGNTGGRRAWLRGTLVIAEIAIALVLLIGASLLGQTFLKLQRVDLGFTSSNLLTATLGLPATQYPKPEQKIAFYGQLLERVKTLPGVTSASGVMPLPVSGNDATGSFQIVDRPAAQGEEPESDFSWINLDYFKTMKIAFVAGRDFTAQDNLKTSSVVIVNEALVKEHFPDQNPIGKRLGLPLSSGEEESTTVEIIGVVKDVKQRTSLNSAVASQIYIPYAQLPFFDEISLVVRTDTEPGSLAKAIQSEVAQLDKEIPLYEIKAMDQYISTAVAQPKFTALLFGIFAGVALLLSAVGLYGVMSYTVTQRTHEIGIRRALGAQTGDVLTMVVGQGMLLTLMGVALGLVTAYAATRLMESMLFGVTATDPLTFVGVAVVLTGVALLACFVPARRAAKTDPMVALRYE
jgi:putative ABC transport system permease protein